jgi:hypothetical protein
LPLRTSRRRSQPISLKKKAVKSIKSFCLQQRLREACDENMSSSKRRAMLLKFKLSIGTSGI